MSNKWENALKSIENSSNKDDNSLIDFKIANQSKQENVYKQKGASFWKRNVAWTIDVFPFIFIYFNLVKYLINHPSLNNSYYINYESLDFLFFTLKIILAVSLITGILWFVYNIVMEKKFSTTVGKYLLGLKVVKNYDLPLSYQDCISRFFSSGVSWLTFNVGHMFILWRDDNLSLHDLLSDTKVVEDGDVKLHKLPPLPTSAIKFIYTMGLVVQFFLIMIFTTALLNVLI